MMRVFVANRANCCNLCSDKMIAENFEIIAVPCASILSCTFLGFYQFAPPDPECINGYRL